LDDVVLEFDGDFPDESHAPVSKRKTRSVLDISESSTGFYDDAGNKHTIFETFFSKDRESLFDMEEVVTMLNAKLNKKQKTILEYLITDNELNGSDIARELGVTRQAINLHLHEIRKHTRNILKKLAPGVKTDPQ
jgi:predicted DNA-binding protein YlxM (UPF0122 family)